jgi:hypothetical protein
VFHCFSRDVDLEIDHLSNRADNDLKSVQVDHHVVDGHVDAAVVHRPSYSSTSLCVMSMRVFLILQPNWAHVDRP